MDQSNLLQRKSADDRGHGLRPRVAGMAHDERHKERQLRVHLYVHARALNEWIRTQRCSFIRACQRRCTLSVASKPAMMTAVSKRPTKKTCSQITRTPMMEPIV